MTRFPILGVGLLMVCVFNLFTSISMASTQAQGLPENPHWGTVSEAVQEDASSSSERVIALWFLFWCIMLSLTLVLNLSARRATAKRWRSRYFVGILALVLYAFPFLALYITYCYWSKVTSHPEKDLFYISLLFWTVLSALFTGVVVRHSIWIGRDGRISPAAESPPNQSRV